MATEFRRDQARVMIISVLRALAPRMAGKFTLLDLMIELAHDTALWAELAELRKQAKMPP